MTILMECPGCGLDDTHEILYEYVNERGEVLDYRVHCLRCEHVWTEVI